MVTLLFSIVVVVLLCAAAVWVIGRLAPSHPPIVDNLIWVLCVVLVVMLIVTAFGIVDIPVPQLR